MIKLDILLIQVYPYYKKFYFNNSTFKIDRIFKSIYFINRYLDKILNILIEKIGDNNKQIREGCEVAFIQASNNK